MARIRIHPPHAIRERRDTPFCARRSAVNEDLPAMLGLRIIALRNPGHRVSICWRAPDSRQGKIIPPQQLLWKESEPGPSLIRPFAVRSAKPIDMIWFVFPVDFKDLRGPGSGDNFREDRRLICYTVFGLSASP
jgi:hypothetical protein